MTIRMFGGARSLAFRILWRAGELGLDDEPLKVDFADGGIRRRRAARELQQEG
jgi:hypothetical protein